MKNNRPPYLWIPCALWAALLFLPGAWLGGQSRDIANAFTEMEQFIEDDKKEITSEDAYYIGRSVGARVLSVYRPYTANPALTAYLNRICGAITANSIQPELYNGYHVMILDTREINALATPGGHIFITLGLVEAASSEDVLAAVIAHEVAHIQLQHGIESIKIERLTQSLNDVARSAIESVGQGLSAQERQVLFAESISGLVDTLMRNGYSREQELSADSLALALLAGAGYDPASLIEILRILQTARQPGGLNATHPSPYLRISNVEQQIRNYRVQDTRPARTARFRNK